MPHPDSHVSTTRLISPTDLFVVVPGQAHQERRYCAANYLSHGTLSMLEGMRAQLLSELTGAVPRDVAGTELLLRRFGTTLAWLLLILVRRTSVWKHLMAHEPIDRKRMWKHPVVPLSDGSGRRLARSLRDASTAARDPGLVRCVLVPHHTPAVAPVICVLMPSHNIAVPQSAALPEASVCELSGNSAVLATAAAVPDAAVRRLQDD